LKQSTTVMEIFEQRVAEQPDRIWLKFRTETYTPAAFEAEMRACAGRLASAGVTRGDILPTFFGNCGMGVVSWFAAMHLGATWAPINTGFRGEQLIRALSRVSAGVILIDQSFLDIVQSVLPDIPAIQTVIVHGLRERSRIGNVDLVPLGSLDIAVIARARVPKHAAAMIQFTSGSTGMSKAVELSHGYLSGQAVIFAREYGLRSDDVLYCPFPLYHWDATVGTVLASLYCGGQAALAERFSVSGFWDDIRAFEATVFDFMGATLSFLNDVPSTPQDAQNTVRMAWGVPMPPFKREFEHRFGLVLKEGYGSTEGGVIVFQRDGETYPPGSCGRVAPEYEIRIADDRDEPVAAGEVGEIQTRPTADACLMMSGYYGMPEETARMLRGGWYHTGDLGWLDEDNNLYFSGRKKDVIRRRGENISALEIEQVIERHPGVAEVAAYGVPSPYTEEDVAVSIVCRAGVRLTRSDVIEFCTGKMASYMVPLHVRFLDTLPKTGTEKVAKSELRQSHAEELSRVNVS
jgi:crotonobetaine/carnitine-CoA ligase